MFIEEGIRWAADQRLVWAELFDELIRADTNAAVVSLLQKQPLPTMPGCQYYANLSLFMHSCTMPDRSTAAELSQYLRIIRKLGPGLDVPTKMISQIEGALMTAIIERYPRLGQPL